MQHRFGGRWTAEKLSVLQDYLKQYVQALKWKNFTLHYVDAFAGSGSFAPKGGDTREQKGSALIAMGVPGFHHLHFIEKGSRRCQHLRKLVADHEGADIVVLEGDANRHLRELCSDTNWKSSRAVLFLDPYGMQVDWETLEAVASTGAIDVWYLFPLSGVTRQLTLRESNMDMDKKKSLDRVLGTDAWREAFYDTNPAPDLFGDTSVNRHADSEAIVKWVSARLGQIFPLVVGPEVLRRGSKGRADGGPPLFALYFLASSRSEKAKDVAGRIARGVLKKLRRDVHGVG
jgi:three-Cys-motif partner protein